MLRPLPPAYAWLASEPGPKILVALLSVHGLAEAEGAADNPAILRLADEAGIADYGHDATPWCGLALAWAAAQAGFDRPDKPLWALDWLRFGTPVEAPMLGDVLVFARDGGGHVGLYVGEDTSHWHVLGGNQGDQVSIRRFARRGGLLTLKGARRCPWRSAQPANVRCVMLAADGASDGSVT